MPSEVQEQLKEYRWKDYSTLDDEFKGTTIEDETDDTILEDTESPSWKECLNQIGGEVINHPREVELDTIEDVISESLMKH